MYKTGLIVGKFCPLHRGHEYLITTAKSRCDKLFVLSYVNPEFPGCEPEKRRRWLNQLFPEVESLVLDRSNLADIFPNQEYGEVMPNNNSSDTEQRQFVAEVYRRFWNVPLDVVFTSEAYGDGFAQELSQYFSSYPALLNKVVHELVDIKREAVPISGSLLRNDIHVHRNYLDPRVYADFVKRICFLGGESSGKSTLAIECAKWFSTLFVEEYGRTLWEEKNGRLDFDDLCQIAETHMANEDRALLNANRYLFVDTSPLTTLFYCQYLFGRVDPRLEQMAERSYAHTFLCVPDFPFVQDGTRQGDTFRMRQHSWYLNQLSARKVSFTLLSGTIAERCEKIERRLESDLL